MIYVQANDTNYYKNPEIGLDRWRLRIHADGTAELIVKHHESNNAAANLAGVIQILREHDYLFEPYGDRIDYVDRIFTGSKLEPAAIQQARELSATSLLTCQTIHADRLH